jgi:ketosteroid isomerase-like protein
MHTRNQQVRPLIPPGRTDALRARLFAVVALLLISFPLVGVGCGGDGSTSDSGTQSTADVVRATEHARLRALLNNNLDAALKLHADDFELINPLGETVSKEAYIDSGDAFAYTSWKPISPIRVRVHGDVAVIRYKSDIEIHGTRGQYWHTDLYEKRDGQWKVVWSQTTGVL